MLPNGDTVYRNQKIIYDNAYVDLLIWRETISELFCVPEQNFSNFEDFILKGYDFTVLQNILYFGKYDGEGIELYIHDIESILKKELLWSLNHKSMQELNDRINKYTKRGFTICTDNMQHLSKYFRYPLVRFISYDDNKCMYKLELLDVDPDHYIKLQKLIELHTKIIDRPEIFRVKIINQDEKVLICIYVDKNDDLKHDRPKFSRTQLSPFYPDSYFIDLESYGKYALESLIPGKLRYLEEEDIYVP